MRNPTRIIISCDREFCEEDQWGEENVEFFTLAAYVQRLASAELLVWPNHHYVCMCVCIAVAVGNIFRN